MEKALNVKVSLSELYDAFDHICYDYGADITSWVALVKNAGTGVTVSLSYSNVWTRTEPNDFAPLGDGEGVHEYDWEVIKVVDLDTMEEPDGWAFLRESYPFTVSREQSLGAFRKMSKKGQDKTRLMYTHHLGGYQVRMSLYLGDSGAVCFDHKGETYKLEGLRHSVVTVYQGAFYSSLREYLDE